MSTRLRLLLGSVVLTAVGCQSSSPELDNHWNIESVGPRVFRHLTGYREDLDGDFPSFQYGQKKDINLTLRRHFLNNNPKNPMQADDPGFYASRRNQSLVPDLPNYIHVEGLVMGGTILALSGAFVPIPLESVLASILVGAEFGAGFTDTWKGKWSTYQPHVPTPAEFTVKNR
ncbi:MAG: hypothetical protein CMJ89_06290 [Planctomycetes bacterium]|jgi:hypothetical protein|nr:hypothetical protein [Planctomycetota bacterium]